MFAPGSPNHLAWGLISYNMKKYSLFGLKPRNRTSGLTKYNFQKYIFIEAVNMMPETGLISTLGICCKAFFKNFLE